MNDLSIGWGKEPVLHGLNLIMRPGERIAIIGPSGCGKSTILRLLAGLLLPTQGSLSLFGQNQSYLRLDQDYPPDVRLVFQNAALLGSLTVEENVGFILRKSNHLTKDEIQIKVKESLTAVGLYDVATKYPGELSGGMQKRVSFARALINEPLEEKSSNPLMLYDEPTAGLDPIASTRIEDLILRTTEVARGCSIVVSHVLSTIERTSRRILILYKGQFQWDGSIEDFKESDNPYVRQFRSGNLQGPMQVKEI